MTCVVCEKDLPPDARFCLQCGVQVSDIRLDTEDQQAHDLTQFLRTAMQEMQNDYNRNYRRARTDPGTAGDEGEEGWANLLRHWLPGAYTVKTKGQIMTTQGDVGPQMDVIVLKPSYPKGLLDDARHVYLASGVAAAFECKRTLNPEYIRDAVRTAATLSQRLTQASSSPTNSYRPGVRLGTPYKELQSEIIFGLLANSHIWQRPDSNPKDNIARNIVDFSNEISATPRDQIDLVCVANVGTWWTYKIPWIGVSTIGESGFEYAQTGFDYQRDYAQPGYPPVGIMLTALMHKMAWEDASLRSLVGYFENVTYLVGTAGSANEIDTTKQWKIDIYSEIVQEGIRAGYTAAQSIFEYNPWDEWRSTIR